MATKVSTNIDQPILVIGNGLLGSSIYRRLKLEELDVQVTDREILNLLNQQELFDFFSNLRRDTLIIFAAGVSGGIKENIENKFKFYAENSLMLSNLITACQKFEFSKIINLVPACVYPANLQKPAEINDLSTGPMEPTSFYYSSAKLSGYYGFRAAQENLKYDWTNIIVSNVYGKYDARSKEDTHVIPQLIKKIKQAKMQNSPYVEILGDGSSVRDFIINLDVADAIYFYIINELWELNNFNISGCEPITILNLTKMISQLVDYKGEIRTNNKSLNGANYKVLNSSQFNNLGWRPKFSLEKGLELLINN